MNAFAPLVRLRRLEWIGAGLGALALHGLVLLGLTLPDWTDEPLDATQATIELRMVDTIRTATVVTQPPPSLEVASPAAWLEPSRADALSPTSPSEISPVQPPAADRVALDRVAPVDRVALDRVPPADHLQPSLPQATASQATASPTTAAQAPTEEARPAAREAVPVASSGPTPEPSPSSPHRRQARTPSPGPTIAIARAERAGEPDAVPKFEVVTGEEIARSAPTRAPSPSRPAPQSTVEPIGVAPQAVRPQLSRAAPVQPSEPLSTQSSKDRETVETPGRAPAALSNSVNAPRLAAADSVRDVAAPSEQRATPSRPVASPSRQTGSGDPVRSSRPSAVAPSIAFRAETSAMPSGASPVRPSQQAPTRASTNRQTAETSADAVAVLSGSDTTTARAPAADTEKVAALSLAATPQIRQAIRTTTADATCGDGSAMFVDDRIHLEGYVSSIAAHDGLRNQIDELAGTQPEMASVAVVGPTLCGFLQTISTGSSADGPELALNDPDGIYREGQFLVIQATSPARGKGYLYVDFVDVNGQVLHMLPSQFHDLRRLHAGEVIQLGVEDPRLKGDAYEMAAPFGQAMIVAHWSAAPLFLDPRPEIESVADYLPELSKALKSNSEEVHSSFVFIEIQPITEG